MPPVSVNTEIHKHLMCVFMNNGGTREPVASAGGV